MNSATISHNNLQTDDDSIRPDTTIVITEDGTGGSNVHHFYAHHYVLANYSGYFKTLLSHNASTNVINLSTIRPTIFAALLNYMYTGSLDLNYVNVYEIFLASNLLHIPSILERCKTYLSHNQPSSTSSNEIAAGAITSSKPIVIKPIPMKTTYPIVFTPPPRTDRIQFEASIFKPLVTKLKADFNENRQRINGLQLTLTNNGSKESDGNSDMSANTNINLRKNSKTKMKTASVIIDVASCDGPIKFSKVLNTNYKPTEMGAGTDPRQSFVNDGSSDTQSTITNANEILALSLNEKRQTEHGSPSIASHPVSGKRKTEDKHLQYYPCKLCGSKFPSYYFVHKHRKSHHFDRHERKK